MYDIKNLFAYFQNYCFELFLIFYDKRTPLTVPPPQKHYKIVFIKAPTPPSPTAPDIPLRLPDEEKTLVYVLIKRPENPPDIVIPTPPSTPPSKPEVYFIRYKTQVSNVKFVSI